MNFLYPGFLFALISVLIPILIHLFQFRKFKKVYFSHVSFLQNIESQSAQRHKLQQRLILLSRILAIICLVLAFARPYIGQPQALNTLDKSQVSIYIDNSNSMLVAQPLGNNLEIAKRKAKEIVLNYDQNAEFQILTNDFAPNAFRFSNRDQTLQIIDEIKPTSQGRKLASILITLNNRFASQNAEVAYLLSDFQDSFVADYKNTENLTFPIHFIPVRAPKPENLTIDSLWFIQPNKRVNSPLKLVVKSYNYSSNDALYVPFKLIQGDVQKSAWSSSIKANSYHLDTLTLIADKTGWQTAYVELVDSKLPFDNKKYFSFEVQNEQSLLIFNGADARNYLAYAFEADTYFKPKEQSELKFEHNLLRAQPVIFLNELKYLSTGIGQSLKNYLETGGQVCLFPSSQSTPAELQNFINSLGLNVKIQSISGLHTVKEINWKHSLFQEILIGKQTSFQLPEVSKYFSYKFNPSTNIQNLMSYENGDAFLSMASVGKGKVYLFSSALSDPTHNFAKHPLFLPILYRMVQTAQNPAALYYEIAEEVYLSMAEVPGLKSEQLRLINDSTAIIPTYKGSQSAAQLYIADQVKFAGFYDLMQSNIKLATYAFNNDKTESELKYISQEHLNQLLPSAEVHDLNSTSTQSLVTKQHKGQEYWKLCLILSLVFILLEILLVRFYTTKNRIQA